MIAVITHHHLTNTSTQHPSMVIRIR